MITEATPPKRTTKRFAWLPTKIKETWFWLEHYYEHEVWVDEPHGCHDCFNPITPCDRPERDRYWKTTKVTREESCNHSWHRLGGIDDCPNCELKASEEKVTKNLSPREVEVLKYCQAHTGNMWAAKIVGLILECDFRDSKAEVDAFFGTQSKPRKKPKRKR